jgi:hypothetical protein
MNGVGSIAFAALGVLLAGYVATKWWQRHGFHTQRPTAPQRTIPLP